MHKPHRPRLSTQRRIGGGAVLVILLRCTLCKWKGWIKTAAYVVGGALQPSGIGTAWAQGGAYTTPGEPRTMPANALVAGNPAKVERMIEQ